MQTDIMSVCSLNWLRAATNAICRHFFRQRIKGIWRLPAALTDATFNHTKNKVASSVERLPPETTARKILPLLDLLAKFKRVLACKLARWLVLPKCLQLLAYSLSCQYCSKFCKSFFGLK